MKVNECPKCGSKDLSDIWCTGRMLRQQCRECVWQGKPRIPEIKPILTEQEIYVDAFGGYHYEAFDKYGHTVLFSKSYNTEEKALVSIKKTIEEGKKVEYGPYTIILWPEKVKVDGKVFY